jgi:hypothetical protein
MFRRTAQSVCLTCVVATLAIAFGGLGSALAALPQEDGGSVKLALAESGQARACIVTDRELRNWREQLAVRDLSEYLYRVTGAVFSIVKAGDEKPEDTCIYVHRVAAEKLGVDLAKLDDERWIVKTAGKNLCLTGGARDGYLSAVYHFLEDVVGVHWWSAFEESVPQTRDLSIGMLDLAGQPAFSLRRADIPGYNRAPACGKDSLWALRSRLDYWYTPASNGEFSWNYHWRDAASPDGHNYLQFVPTERFGAHPEWFAEIDGQRTIAARDLCMTNEAVRRYVAEGLVSTVAGAAKHNRDLGWAEPRLFYLCREDGADWCQCANCRDYVAKTSRTDLTLDFVNSVAAEVEKAHPSVLIGFFAYQGVSQPPKHIKPRSNVLPLFCTEARSEADTINDPLNVGTLACIKGWKSVTDKLGVYGYRRTFSRFQGSYGASGGYDFPSSTVLTMADDARLLKSLNVVAQFVQVCNVVTVDMQEMKIWMQAKLMEDPVQDGQRLLSTFIDGYYGSAAPAVRQYLDLLVAAHRRRPSNIYFFADLLQYTHLDLAFLQEADHLFTETSKVTPEVDWKTHYRLNHLRLGVDRAILFNWPRLLRQWVIEAKPVTDFPLSRQEILARYKQTMIEQMQVRGGLWGLSMAEMQAIMDDELAIFARRLYWNLPLPAQFASTDRKRIFDFPAQSGVFAIGSACRLVDDAATAGGKAICVTGAATTLPLTWQYQPTWDSAKPSGHALTAEQIKGDGYTWHNLGNYQFDTSNTGLVFFDGDAKVTFWGSAVDAGEYEVWAEMAFEKSGAVRIGRVIAISAAAPPNQ